jgi:hypothetical protein
MADRTQAPRGYVVWYDDEWQCICFGLLEDGSSLNAEPLESEEQAVAAAWAHWEANR